MIVAFHAFGPAHLGVLCAVPASAAALGWLQRSRPAAGRAIHFILALLLLANGAALYLSYALAGEPLFPRHLPLELCDMSVFLAAATLLTLRPALYDLVYYWALAGA